MELIILRIDNIKGVTNDFIRRKHDIRRKSKKSL